MSTTTQARTTMLNRIASDNKKATKARLKRIAGFGLALIGAGLLFTHIELAPGHSIYLNWWIVGGFALALYGLNLADNNKPSR